MTRRRGRSRAVCPGSFDPVTHGHLDVIGRAAELFDEVIVAVGANVAKNALFTPVERVAMLTEACADLPGVRVDVFDGLLVDFWPSTTARAIVKGLRFAADFDYELPMAQMNRTLTGVDTVFVPTAPAVVVRVQQPGAGGRRARGDVRLRSVPARGRRGGDRTSAVRAADTLNASGDTLEDG